MKQPDSINRRTLLLRSMALAGLTVGGLGCANWREKQEETKSLLQQPQLARNTVIVEIAFVRITENLAQPIRELWQRTDEQNLSVEVRRRLYANGIRTGTLGTELPSVLRRGLDEQQMTVEEIANYPAALQNPTTRQYRLQCRSGKVIPVAVSPDFRDRTIQIRKSGAIRIRTFEDCQCVIELEAAPLANGMAAVHLMPMVEFGEAKSRPVGSEGIWQVGVRKEHQRIANLAISLELRPGETILLTATDPPHGVGNAFFGGGDPATSGRRLMLLRLAQTQRDGVFETPTNTTNSP